ncbi:PTS system IIA component (L-Asc family) [Mycoplasmopsis mustelae]|uniref:Ascorbate-specific PTS system EIIA component n=1 Tax=Mycoplasmopsis mustelae TaxID=171289 RepID=A0A4R7UC88_9BACT|nr:PTS sugar transporter subunit IIA [Mycoplasmopsis mustelae]TDV23536.1 PTS system IIA component (L-Asc family) [Mycoplasmopsis mustelae]
MKLFDPKMIIYLSKEINWKQAIHLGVKMLVDNQKASFQLENEILKSTEKFGAYYVLEKGIALLHAPAGSYCYKPATSTLILDKEIIFNNQADKVAKIIITLSAPDNDSHFDLIAEFAKYFGDTNFKEKVLSISSLQEFLDLIKQWSNNEI